jgi:hypothetical protein
MFLWNISREITSSSFDLAIGSFGVGAEEQRCFDG